MGNERLVIGNEGLDERVVIPNERLDVANERSLIVSDPRSSTNDPRTYAKNALVCVIS
jgi:hypothetical protein